MRTSAAANSLQPGVGESLAISGCKVSDATRKPHFSGCDTVSSRAVLRAWRTSDWGQASLEDPEAAPLPAVSDGVSLALGTNFPGGVCHLCLWWLPT